ncbi:alpha/beta hydrolase, partial [Chromobacterium piscinae]
MQAFDLIIQPGWRNSGPSHWQSHWQRRLGARRVDNADWERPQLEDWLDGLDAALARCAKPPLVIAHSLG